MHFIETVFPLSAVVPSHHSSTSHRLKKSESILLVLCIFPPFHQFLHRLSWSRFDAPPEPFSKWSVFERSGHEVGSTSVAPWPLLHLQSSYWPKETHNTPESMVCWMLESLSSTHVTHTLSLTWLAPQTTPGLVGILPPNHCDWCWLHFAPSAH